MREHLERLAARFDALPKRERALIAAAVLLAVAFLFYLVLLQPGLAAKKRLAGQLAEARNTLATLQQLNARPGEDPFAGRRAERDTLRKQLGDIDRSMAQTYIDSYFARYPGVKRYMDETRRRARELGYVETVFGRRLWLPELKSGAPVRRQAAERAAINAPMQGTAADLIKLAMIAVQNWLDEEKRGTKLIMQVHDELVLEVPQAELDTVKSKVTQLMQSVATLEVPLLVEVGVGDNWDQAH